MLLKIEKETSGFPNPEASSEILFVNRDRVFNRSSQMSSGNNREAQASWMGFCIQSSAFDPDVLTAYPNSILDTAVRGSCILG